ncbi:cytochrome o ubiquinol oxidase subunit IV [uncultured Kushneria sp.]|uniref:cytochrome o ubiquinol oxidase subunit IV n=1 Tax=uncultured Kushneria sp. TaxID=905033 RepID=UPI002601E0D0|nr:cytochrome o ubiquinol oxidase subunit IV [uncultured Kushneria sp.]
MSNQHHSQESHDHGSVKSYTTGLILSIILTVIPFGLVMTGALSAMTTLAAIMIMAVVQIVVQVVYFLHLNEGSGPRWNMISLWFTILIVGIVVVGSVWIMFHLNHNLMVGM